MHRRFSIHVKGTEPIARECTEWWGFKVIRLHHTDKDPKKGTTFVVEGDEVNIHAWYGYAPNVPTKGNMEREAGFPPGTLLLWSYEEELCEEERS